MRWIVLAAVIPAVTISGRSRDEALRTSATDHRGRTRPPIHCRDVDLEIAKVGACFRRRSGYARSSNVASVLGNLGDYRIATAWNAAQRTHPAARRMKELNHLAEKGCMGSLYVLQPISLPSLVSPMHRAQCISSDRGATCQDQIDLGGGSASACQHLVRLLHQGTGNLTKALARSTNRQ